MPVERRTPVSHFSCNVSGKCYAALMRYNWRRSAARRGCGRIAIGTLLSLFYIQEVFSFPNVVIHSVDNVNLDAPTHHGLSVKIDKLWDPNLNFYEVQLKPDSGGIYPPWAVYNTTIKPFDGEMVIIPYRNGIMALKTSTKYCLRMRAVYASGITPWVESCGIVLSVGNVSQVDSDGDGLSNAQEYALGTDPNNKDSDLDSMADKDELNNNTDPNKALYANVFVKTPSLDFGVGNNFGTYPGQHQFILIVNKGDQVAKIDSIKLSSPHFKIGTYSQLLTHIPPKNELRLPVSFLPQSGGNHQATVEVKIAYDPEPLPLVQLYGAGSEMPNCIISTENESLDFGEMVTTHPNSSF